MLFSYFLQYKVVAVHSSYMDLPGAGTDTIKTERKHITAAVRAIGSSIQQQLARQFCTKIHITAHPRIAVVYNVDTTGCVSLLMIDSKYSYRWSNNNYTPAHITSVNV